MSVLRTTHHFSKRLLQAICLRPAQTELLERLLHFRRAATVLVLVLPDRHDHLLDDVVPVEEPAMAHRRVLCPCRLESDVHLEVRCGQVLHQADAVWQAGGERAIPVAPRRALLTFLALLLRATWLVLEHLSSAMRSLLTFPLCPTHNDVTITIYIRLSAVVIQLVLLAVAAVVLFLIL